MQVCLFVETQRGVTYAALAGLARHAEQAGFGGVFVSDHYHPAGKSGTPLDAWVALAGLARETSRIRLGTLVTAATFRLPGPLAICVAQVDAMSGGRAELGLGAGWHKPDHTGYGIPFPDVTVRFDRLAEQLEIIAGLWETPPSSRFRYRGEHYQLVDAPPVTTLQRPHPPIIIGGSGRRRTPQLADWFADEYNAGFCDPIEATYRFDRVTKAVHANERPWLLRLSAGMTVACGRTVAEATRRADRLGGTYPRPTAWAIGSLEHVTGRIKRYAEAGATRVYLSLPDPADMDHVDLLAQALPDLADPPVPTGKKHPNRDPVAEPPCSR